MRDRPVKLNHFPPSDSPSTSNRLLALDQVHIDESGPESCKSSRLNVVVEDGYDPRRFPSRLPTALTVVSGLPLPLYISKIPASQKCKPWEDPSSRGSGVVSDVKRGRSLVEDLDIWIFIVSR